MYTLQDFEQQLMVLIGKPTDLRPFVCDGSPLQCQAFIVGINPATKSSEDFWQFWRTDYGFDKSAWFESYLKERQNLPLKPGKKRRNAISNTRRIIEWVVAEALPIRCLETNIYALPTEQAVELTPGQRSSSIFDFLLTTIKPRVVVTHGLEAENLISQVQISAKLISVSHFSRGWSEVRARELGRQIRIGSGQVPGN